MCLSPVPAGVKLIAVSEGDRGGCHDVRTKLEKTGARKGRGVPLWHPAVTYLPLSQSQLKHLRPRAQDRVQGGSGSQEG